MWATDSLTSQWESKGSWVVAWVRRPVGRASPPPSERVVAFGSQHHQPTFRPY